MREVLDGRGRRRVRRLGTGLVAIAVAAATLGIAGGAGSADAKSAPREPNEQSRVRAPIAQVRTRQAVIDAAFARAARAKATPSRNGDTSYALTPVAPLPQCTYGTIWNWPKVYENGTTNPCWVRGPAGTNTHIVGPTPSQTLMPNSMLHLGVADTMGGWENKAAYLLSWNNLWDYQPLMGGSNGAVGNDYTDQSLFVIPPSIDNSGCYDATQAYLYGRFVADCALRFGKGPYYGTPAGQTIPYTRFVGSSIWTGHYNSPFPSNCGGTCNLNFSYYSPVYMEMPIFIEPSPYAGISKTQTGATVNFTDSTLADLQETSWQWDFGDGKTSSAQNPIHNYDRPGTYTVRLTVRVADGQSDTTTTTVNVTQQYKISGAVKDLSHNGVATTLTLTNLGDATTQAVNVATDGTYAVAVDPGSYKVATDAAAPVGLFTPKTRTLTVTNANVVANFTANTRRVTVTMTDNIGRPVTGIAIPIAPAATTYGSLVTDGAGIARIEVVNGTYTLTPTDPHPGQGFQFVPPTRTVTVAGVDVATSFVYKAAVFVSAVTPNVGGAKGGNTVTVTGGGFKQGGVASVTAVKFQLYPGKALAGKNIVVVSDSQLTVTAPKANSLFGPSDTSVSTDLLVTSGAYTSGVTPDDVYAFGNLPEVTAVTVNDGPIIGGTKIKLTGRHFTGALAVTFEPVDTMPVRAAATYTVDSDTQISVTVPGYANTYAPKHVADVRVRTAEGKSPTGFADHFNYREVHVVQLGDSIASGEGINYGFTFDPTFGHWTIGNANPSWDGPYQLCHQSGYAYSHYVTQSVSGSLTTFACTGGTYLEGVEGDAPGTASPAQFGNWPGGANVNAAYDTANPDVVLISLGADDIAFSEIVGDCVTNFLNPVTALRCIPGNLGPTIMNDFYGNLPGVGTHLRQLIKDIQARGKASPGGVAPRIVVQDYYDPWPANPAASCPDNNDLATAQVTTLKGLVTKLDLKIANAVNGIAATDKTVKFVELHDALVGHQWCDPDEWAYGISIRTYNLLLSNQAPFHPTVAGQQAMAQAVTPVVSALLVPSK